MVARRSRSRAGQAVLALVACLATVTTAQHDMTSNVTNIEGTWSSGTGGVMTGSGFANPVNNSFVYPKTTGISFSFTEDGYFEEAQYRFIANGSQPNCIKAIILWQHGSYTMQPNGSITTAPIAADGRIQVQDPCAAVTSVLTYYYQPGYYETWNIYNDVNHNTYNLQLQAFDGSLMPRLFLVARPPNMLPLTQLTTGSTVSQTSDINSANESRRRKRNLQHPIELYKRWVDYWTL